jgi:transposase-like protein
VYREGVEGQSSMNRYTNFAADSCVSRCACTVSFDRAGRRLLSSRMELTSHRVHATQSHGNKFSDAQKQSALARWAGGESVKAIALDLNCHQATIRRWRNPSSYGGGAHPGFCPRCAELVALIKLLIASADASPDVRRSVSAIASKSIEPARADSGETGGGR